MTLPIELRHGKTSHARSKLGKRLAAMRGSVAAFVLLAAGVGCDRAPVVAVAPQAPPSGDRLSTPSHETWARYCDGADAGRLGGCALFCDAGFAWIAWPDGGSCSDGRRAELERKVNEAGLPRPLGDFAPFPDPRLPAPAVPLVPAPPSRQTYDDRNAGPSVKAR